ncbi:hypothetical protein SAMN03159338_4266 [Sphingomonas sp. NFR04]|uniref:hypothetical protein n=1 Tax=Sphingomonas sp. NFR04 TaxID=1566283 RepID=UPI0008EE66B6|nr:hypothetical protein [Sphingomonas sp. NFR04]SFK44367.1 hypothetical protein SAMN03159338_4266 [Sphingomonas sp. NFR04]
MTEDPRLAAHRAQMQVAGTQIMTADEILAGQSQAGVPRPRCLKEHEDDGSVQSLVAGGVQ